MKKGFTLVELLVVLAILGILMAMMVPAAGIILNRAQNAQAKSDASVVAATMLKYFMEYNRWPPSYASSPAGTRFETDDKWVAIMSPPPRNAGDPPDPNDENIRRIVFFEPGSGVLATEGVNKGYFVDAWGNPFKFILDTSGAQSVLNPDPEPADGEPTEIPERVIAWSSGKDRSVNNETGEAEWNDNPKSWW